MSEVGRDGDRDGRNQERDDGGDRARDRSRSRDNGASGGGGGGGGGGAGGEDSKLFVGNLSFEARYSILNTTSENLVATNLITHCRT